MIVIKDKKVLKWLETHSTVKVDSNDTLIRVTALAYNMSEKDYWKLTQSFK